MLPCCESNSTVSCCIHPQCSSYNQSTTCYHVSSDLLQLDGNPANENRCNVTSATTVYPELNSSSVTQTTDTKREFSICVTTCPFNFYADSNQNCKECDEACSNCRAPGTLVGDCACLYGNNGTHCCPPDTSHKINNKTFCDSTPSAETPNVIVAIVTATSVGVVLVLMTGITIMVVLRRRTARARELSLLLFEMSSRPTQVILRKHLPCTC